MRKIFHLFASLLLVASSLQAANYSTEVTIAPQKDKRTCVVTVHLSELIEKGGKLTEKLLFRPKITTPLGESAHLYAGPSPESPDYKETDHITADVSWPEPGKQGRALCTVILQRGDRVISKSKFLLEIEESK